MSAQTLRRNQATKSSFGYTFPAIRGIQAKREYYVSMCPLKLLPKLFLFDDEYLVPEIRAQRTLNRGRLPEIADYIVKNRENYVFSAITASVDGDIRFQSFGDSDGMDDRLGVLQISMDARFIINDGQHRRAAIELALKEKPELANETIAVVLFIDSGLERCQQMFADLNRYAIRPSQSLGILYDHRDDMAKLAKLLVMRSEVFKDIVDMEKSTLSERSRRLFTLSAIYTATAALLTGRESEPEELRLEIAMKFWEQVGAQLPEWQLVRENKLSAGEVRRDYIHSHGVVLHALANTGRALLKENGKLSTERLKKLKSINWSRNNAKLWEGRAINGGRVSNTGNHVTLTTNAIKQHLAIYLTPEEQRVENAFARGDYEQ